MLHSKAVVSSWECWERPLGFSWFIIKSKEWEWLKPFLSSVVLMLFPEMQAAKEVPYESTVVTETILLLGC